MRWSRFKQQMEGTQPRTRNPKTTTPRGKKRKAPAVENQEQEHKIERKDGEETQAHIKPEPERGIDPMLGVQAVVPTVTKIKSEPERSTDPMLDVPLVPSIPMIKPEPEQALQNLQTIPNHMDSERMRWLSMNEAPQSSEYTAPQAAMSAVPEAPADSQGSFVLKAKSLVKVEPHGNE